MLEIQPERQNDATKLKILESIKNVSKNPKRTENRKIKNKNVKI